MVNSLVIVWWKCRNHSFMENTPIRTVLMQIKISRADFFQSLFCSARHNFIFLNYGWLKDKFHWLLILWNICNPKAVLTLQLLCSSDVTVVKIPNMEFLKHEQPIPWSRATGHINPRFCLQVLVLLQMRATVPVHMARSKGD